ncbi:hypothetical protein AOX55_00006580 (plasmid) [Sinorhizobium fredii CCBAU 25509]|nr:hypothetical protein AOX55_00006580 [Sinorhizobium fredii CCBAU 25509]
MSRAGSSPKMSRSWRGGRMKLINAAEAQNPAVLRETFIRMFLAGD